MSGVLRVTVLGCGSSGGVPRLDGEWGACDPKEPRNARTRCSLLLQRWSDEAGAPEEATTVLIDTAPEIRQQFARSGARRLDGLVYTHEHADQVHGIDDVRAIAYRMRRRIPTYMDRPTAETLLPRFRYLFEGDKGYPPILERMPEIAPYAPFTIDGPGGSITLEPLLQDHGTIASLGFRIGRLGYSNDLVAMPEDSFERLEGLDLWIADALRYEAHPTHSHLAQTLAWRDRLNPTRTILTNLHIDMDYRTLVDTLPNGVEPAYDGLSVELPA